MGLFGPEKITLMLEKYNYTPGDTIKGTVTLKLKKPTNARKFDIMFAGKITERQTGMGIGNTSRERNRRTSVSYVYKFNMPLGGEGEYQQGEYPFEIKIPEDIKQSIAQPDGKVGTAVSAIKSLQGVHQRIDWFVRAKLDVPAKLDVRKSQKITLS